MILLATTERIAGKRVAKTLGLAYGTVTRATPIGGRMIAAIKSLLGGELEEYTKTLAESREHALDRLRDHARSLGANAVIGLRFASVELMPHAAELVAYGTAVVVEDDAGAG